VTPEAEAHLLARLEAELLGIESQRARNAAEAHEIRDRADELRRSISNVRNGAFKVGLVP